MLPITKKTTLRIWAKAVTDDDPDHWPGLGGVIFLASLAIEEHGIICIDLRSPILVWNYGQWKTYGAVRDVD